MGDVFIPETHDNGDGIHAERGKKQVTCCSPAETPRDRAPLLWLLPGSPNPASVSVSRASNPFSASPVDVARKRGIWKRRQWRQEGKWLAEAETVRGTDTSLGNLISVLVGLGEDLKQEQGATDKEPSENRKSAWKLKIELLK